MIIVNNREYVWTEGMTVAGLMEKLKDFDRFAYVINRHTIVILNNIRIPSANYATTLIHDRDIIVFAPPVMGG